LVVRCRSIFLLTTTLFAAAAAAFACTSAPVSKLPADPGDDDTDNPDRTRTDSGSTNNELPPGADPPLPDGGKPPGRVFAHTQNKLYRYDPLASSLTEIGPFSCLPRNESDPVGSQDNDAVIDLALDRTGNMYATTFWRFLKVDPTSGSCTVVKTKTENNLYPNSLSFVPMGNEEALVGYAFNSDNAATIYTRIDLTTGEMNDIDDLNPPTPVTPGVTYGISGDLISLVRTNGKTYAAIKAVDGDAGTSNDLLAEINPANGNIVRIIGDTGQQGFYGLGFWAGKAYGFTTSGNIYEVNVTNGSSTLALAAKDDNGLGIEWYGAGVTTDSPTAP
jgi:hypothetical protein